MTDAERLEAAHLGTLSNATFVERARTTVRFENGSPAVEETYVGRHGANASGVTLWRNGTTDYPVPDLSLVEARVWGNASFGVRRFVTVHGRVELGSFDDPESFHRRLRRGYGLALSEAETALGFRRIANGSVEYVLVASGVDVRGPWHYGDRSWSSARPAAPASSSPPGARSDGSSSSFRYGWTGGTPPSVTPIPSSSGT